MSPAPNQNDCFLWRKSVVEADFCGNLSGELASSVFESYLNYLLGRTEIYFYIKYELEVEEFCITPEGELYVSEVCAQALKELIEETGETMLLAHFEHLRPALAQESNN